MRVYKGPMRNSVIREDSKGLYIVIDTDIEGNEYKVYMTPLNTGEVK